MDKGLGMGMTRKLKKHLSMQKHIQIQRMYKIVIGHIVPK
jgi:hypothetical protein